MLKRVDPLDNCSVKNCIFIGDDNNIQSADAVVVHLQHGQIPKPSNRSEDQLWIFLTDEAPPNTFSMSNNKDWTRFANIFNWSMTYRYVKINLTQIITTTYQTSINNTYINKSYVKSSFLHKS